MSIALRKHSKNQKKREEKVIVRCACEGRGDFFIFIPILCACVHSDSRLHFSPSPSLQKVKMTVHVKSFFFSLSPLLVIHLLWFYCSSPLQQSHIKVENTSCHYLEYHQNYATHSHLCMYLANARTHTHAAVFLSFLLPLNFVSGFRFNAVNACVRAFLLFFLFDRT